MATQLRTVRFNHAVTDPSFKGAQQVHAGAAVALELDGDFVRIRATDKKKGGTTIVLVPLTNVSYLLPDEPAPPEAKKAAATPKEDTRPVPVETKSEPRPALEEAMHVEPAPAPKPAVEERPHAPPPRGRKR
jgi:hypothetical protein